MTFKIRPVIQDPIKNLQNLFGLLKLCLKLQGKKDVSQ